MSIFSPLLGIVTLLNHFKGEEKGGQSLLTGNLTFKWLSSRDKDTA